FLPSGKQDLRMYWLSPKLSMRKVSLVLVVYAVFWSIPHAGEMLTKTFRRPNVVAFVLPYIKIGKHFYGVATHAPDRL
ncbi:MAG: hypothetical protein KJN61_04535, partial [Gammaproteobacteria bacterium]|nr:hypothetical protein [Gammaproteobacteria bacterium]